MKKVTYSACIPVPVYHEISVTAPDGLSSEEVIALCKAGEASPVIETNDAYTDCEFWRRVDAHIGLEKVVFENEG